MKVNVGTIELDELQRIALANRLGVTGLVGRALVKSYVQELVAADLEATVKQLLVERGLTPAPPVEAEKKKAAK